jgi:hypothetical protein
MAVIKSDTEPPTSRSRKPWVVLLVLAVLVGGGLYVGLLRNAGKNQATIEQRGLEIAQDLGNYPPLYKQAGLPEYPEAELINPNTRDTNLQTGIALRLTTPDEVKTVEEFYVSKMTELGWQAVSSNFQTGEGVFNKTFTKDKQTYNVYGSRSGEETVITINWQENS